MAGDSFLGRAWKKGSRGTHSPRPPMGPAPLGPPGPHLWVRTVWHSKACGKTASHHARQRVRARGEGRAEAPWTPPPKVGRAPSPLSQPKSGAHLGVAPRSQCLATALTLEAKLVPVLAQGAHLLSCGQEGMSGAPLSPRVSGTLTALGRAGGDIRGPAVPGVLAPSLPRGCNLKQASGMESQLSFTPASIPSLTQVSQAGLKRVGRAPLLRGCPDPVRGNQSPPPPPVGPSRVRTPACLHLALRVPPPCLQLPLRHPRSGTSC